MTQLLWHHSSIFAPPAAKSLADRSCVPHICRSCCVGLHEPNKPNIYTSDL